MSGKIQTSTPIVFPKPNSVRKTWVSQDVGPHLFGSNWSKYRDAENGNWNNIESPNFVDFNNRTSNVDDSYFDTKEPDIPSPFNKEEMKLPSMAEELMDTMDIAESFKTCSISQIDVDEDAIADESTILAGDSFFEDTLMGNRLSLGPKMIKKNDSKKYERRLSTIPTPFSFESREESKQERKEARLAFKAAMEEMNKKAFQPKPAPKFKPRVHLQDKVVSNVKRMEKAVVSQPDAIKIKKETAFVPKKIQKIQIPACFRTSLTQKKEEPKVIRRKELTNINHVNEKPKINLLKEQSKMNHLKDQQKVIHTKEQSKINRAERQPKTNQFKDRMEVPLKKEPIKTVEKNESRPLTQPKLPLTEKSAVVTKADSKVDKPVSNFAQIKKTKPFQVCQAKQTSTIARSPKLATAKRAQQRQLFEERMKERAIQRQERLRQEAADKEAREKEEYARLRKLTVHKARPVPQYINQPPQMMKRPLTDPMMPFFLKRRRMK